MGAVKFIKKRYRICHIYEECKDCPLEKDGDCTDFSNGEPKKIVELVEKWSKEHPIKKEEIKEHCCDNCKYRYLSEDEKPCTSCFRCYYDCFEPKEKKTRQSEFLKLYPNVSKFCNGTIKIRPCVMDTSLKGACVECKYHNQNCDYAKYWNEEVE